MFKAETQKYNFNVWGEDNPCYSCAARCCQNTRLKLGIIGSLASVSGELYEHIVNKDNWISEEEYSALQNRQNGDVYWVVGKSGTHYLTLVGPCPLLDLATLKCTAHNKKRPMQCDITNPSNTYLCP